MLEEMLDWFTKSDVMTTAQWLQSKSFESPFYVQHVFFSALQFEWKALNNTVKTIHCGIIEAKQTAQTLISLSDSDEGNRKIQEVISDGVRDSGPVTICLLLCGRWVDCCVCCRGESSVWKGDCGLIMEKNISFHWVKSFLPYTENECMELSYDLQVLL